MAARPTKALILTHVERESPGAIAELCQQRGLALERLSLDRGAELPSVPPDDALLIVMGGPMGVSDIGGSEFPFLKPEVELLRAAVERDHPTLGICLGAQLLAHAAGARVYPNPRGREVGYGALRLRHELAPELLGDMPEELVVLHWHGDKFEIPEGGRAWASTEICESQAFSLKRRLFGLQFHVEVSPSMLDEWLKHDGTYVTEALGPGAAERMALEARALEPVQRASWNRLLGAVIDQLLAEAG